MKTLRLASIAAQAERVRLKHRVRRIVVQVLLLVIAFGLLMVAVGVGHAALYQLLVERLPPAGAFGVLTGGDIVVALIIVWVALNSSPGEGEREAEALSASARQEIRASFTWTRILFWAFEMFRTRR